MKKRTTLFLTEKMDLCTANYLPKGIWAFLWLDVDQGRVWNSVETDQNTVENGQPRKEKTTQHRLNKKKHRQKQRIEKIIIESLYLWYL